METVRFRATNGLANRLRALVGCRVLADLRRVPLLVDWAINGACAAAFDDLFERAGWEDVRFDAASPPAGDGVALGDELWFTEIASEHAASLLPQAEFERRSLALLRGLRPAAEIRARIDAFSAAHDLSACTGVHIRMTDNLHDVEQRSRKPGFARERISRLEGFTELIGSLRRAGSPVFLATDNERVLERIRASHDVLVYEKSYDESLHRRHVRRSLGPLAPLYGALERARSALGRPAEPVSWRTTPIADALIDLVLLGRCREIVGTYYSSFGEVAALMGGVPLSMMEGTRARRDGFVERLLGLGAAAS